MLPRSAPVLVGGRIGLRVLQELLPLDARAVEDGNHAHGLLLGRLPVVCPGQVGDVGVARAVDHAVGVDGSTAGFTLGQYALQQANIV